MRVALSLVMVWVLLCMFQAIDKIDTNTLYLKNQIEELQAKHNMLVEATRKEIERCHLLNSR